MNSASSTKIKDFTQCFPVKPLQKERQNLYGLTDTAKAWYLHQWLQTNPGHYWIIVDSLALMERLQTALHFFGCNQSVWLLPNHDSLPYEALRCDPKTISTRLNTLLLQGSCAASCTIVTLASLLEKVLPKSAVPHLRFFLQIGQHYSREHLRQMFTRFGYFVASQASEVGECSFKGDKIDLYPANFDLPLRLTFFDDELETIQFYDPETQLSLAKKPPTCLEIYALHEVALTPDQQQQVLDTLDEWNLPDKVQRQIQNTLHNEQGMVHYRTYLPLFYNRLTSAFAFAPANTKLILLDPPKLESAEKFYRQEIQSEYELAAEQPGFLPAIEKLFLTPAEQQHIFQQETALALYEQPPLEQKTTDLVQCLPANPVYPMQSAAQQKRTTSLTPIEAVFYYVQQSFKEGKTLCFSAEQQTGANRIKTHLEEKNIPCQIFSTFPADLLHRIFAQLEPVTTVPIFIHPIEQGFLLEQNNHIFFQFWTDREIFGRYQQKKTSGAKKWENPIHSLEQLADGDYVVHMDYGVGKYVGLSQFHAGQHKIDCLAIEYKDKDKVYVPVDRMHLVQKYSNLGKAPPILHKIGDYRWQTTKKKISQAVESIADELVELYAKRKASSGNSFLEQSAKEEELRRTFAFAETEDQEKAIIETLADLSKPAPMDRLICGDVGFGKTEVAIRAAFRVAINGYQVAMVAPTTILAEQHYYTFAKRLADSFSLRISHVSRFLNKAQVNQVLQQLREGEVDILIGTHRILSDDVVFAKLGLLIIDEEHRFGVKQKEKLRFKKVQVDTLAMSATPIPRTLQMSLSGLRDISLIHSPPVNRRAIKTRVLEFNPLIIKEVILREINRGGQAYFIHNRVETIDAMANLLSELLPKIKLGVAHGKMHKNKLEQVMMQFIEGQIDVLIASTIVESGLDIPNANTMIINNADALGLAQIYQLRGRVGRCDVQAYVYCLTAEGKALSIEGEKRLTALQQLTALGSGFKLAAMDMEIRGAGNFLGAEQSGNVSLVGVETYLQLLNEAIEQKKREGDNQPKQASEDCIFQYGFDSFFPEEYIASPGLRLSFYQSLAKVKTEEEFWQICAAIEDRFGKIPPASQTMFDGLLMKIKAANLGATFIELFPNRMELKMGENFQPNLPKLFQFLQQSQGRLIPPNHLKFTQTFARPTDAEKILNALQDCLLTAA